MSRPEHQAPAEIVNILIHLLKLIGTIVENFKF